MGFKPQLAADLTAIMDEDIFAESMVIDGQTVSAIFEDLEFKDLGPAFVGGLGQARRLFVIAGGLSSSYVPDQLLTLDGIIWTVADIVNENGLLVIDLYRNAS